LIQKLINAKIDIDTKIGMDPKISIDMKIGTNKLIFYFPLTLGEILVDITLAQIKVQNMKMAKWNLFEEVHIRPLNLGIHDKPQMVKLNIDLDLFITNVIEKLLKKYKDD
jgi:hypothetical protein